MPSTEHGIGMTMGFVLPLVAAPYAMLFVRHAVASLLFDSR